VTITDEQLAELEACGAAATSTEYSAECDRRHVVQLTEREYLEWERDRARSAIPTLIAEVRRYRKSSFGALVDAIAFAADENTALRAEVERLRALNGDWAESAADHLRVADDARTQLAAVTAERDRLRARVDVLQHADGDLGTERARVDVLTQKVAAMRPVVQAARALVREAAVHGRNYFHTRQALADAVDAYERAQKERG
jgi:hypothetical protein